MRKNFIAVWMLALSGLTSGVYAQQDRVSDKIIEIGRTDNQVMKHLDILTNRIGGRCIGSNAYDNAVEWVASEFKKWGMEVILDETGELPVGFNRGPWFGKMLSEDGMFLHFATPSYTAGTKGVQRGHVLMEPKTRDEFERMKGALKGAWVLITGENNGWPIDYSEEGDAVRAKILADNEKIMRKNDSIRRENWRNRNKAPQKLIPLKDAPALFYKEMREAGILGIIQSSPVPIRVLYDRKNLMKMSWENLPTLPDIKLEASQYNIIAQKVKERRYFQLEFDIRNHFRMGPVKYYSVLGLIKGTKYPNEYVMLGGHLDAFDVATGGVDCGSGVTVTMEAGRLIKAAGGKPKRSILVCAWSGEEFGLLGSKHWVETNTNKLGKISNYFNRDGGPTVTVGITVPPAMYDDMVSVCAPLNKINPDFPFTVKKRTGEPYPRPTQAGGADHAYFAINGVPTLGFSTDDPKGYNFSYGEIWHTERDLYNKSIPEYQEHSAIVTAVVVYRLANLDHLLSREGLYKEDVKQKK